MADDIVNGFLALKSDEERTETLQKLVNVLRMKEREAVKAAISHKNDIVMSLPAELTLNIFNHLDLLEVWRLRLVSKRWQSVLCSEDFVRTAVSRWNNHEPSDSARSLESVAEESLQSRVRHIQAFSLGRPFFSVIVERNVDSRNVQKYCAEISDLQMKGSYVAYVRRLSQGRDCLLVLCNLCTGSSRILRPDDRLKPRKICLSSTLLTFVSRGVLYVQRLDDLEAELQRFRLPSDSISVVGGDHDTVALVVSNELIMFDRKASTLTNRKFDSRLWTQYTTGHMSIRFRGLLVDNCRQTIDIFVSVAHGIHTEARDLWLYHNRFDFDGKLLRHDTTRGLPFSGLNSGPAAGVEGIEATGNAGLYRLQFCTMGQEQRKHYVLFDIKLGVYVTNYGRSAGGLKAITDTQWKNSIIMPYMDDDEIVPRRAITESSSPRFSEGSMTDEGFGGLVMSQSLVNDSFLACLEKSRDRGEFVRVYCFDENVQMANAESTGLWEWPYDVDKGIY